MSELPVKKRSVLFCLLLCLLAVSSVFVYRSFFSDERFIMGNNTNSSNVKFEWLIKPKYHKAKDFRFGVAWVQEKENGPWRLIDRNGKPLVSDFPAQDIDFYGEDSDLVSFRTSERMSGYLNSSGDVVISPQYWYAGAFREGVAVVSQKTGIGDDSITGVLIPMETKY